MRNRTADCTCQRESRVKRQAAQFSGRLRAGFLDNGVELGRARTCWGRRGSH